MRRDERAGKEITRTEQGPLSYAPVARLLDAEDGLYIAQTPELAGRFQGMRRAAARSYLNELRRDYIEVWDVCRILAPISSNPHYLSSLSRQYWTFHWMFLTAHFHCALRPSIAGRAAGEQLVAILERLRVQAGELLEASDSALAVPSAA